MRQVIEWLIRFLRYGVRWRAAGIWQYITAFKRFGGGLTVRREEAHGQSVDPGDGMSCTMQPATTQQEAHSDRKVD